MSSNWFKIELSKHEYDLLSYCGIAFVKICAIIFFLASLYRDKTGRAEKQKEYLTLE